MSALKLFASLSLLLISSINFAAPCFCAGRETDIPDFQFQPIKPTAAITIAEAVDIAVRNYPTIAQKHFKLRASMANVSLAKTQYLPNLNIDIQESGITGNRVASTIMNNVSGFDTVPVDSGPVSQRSSMRPLVNNLQGLNLNWLMVDCGLRKANDNFAYADARSARADLNLTRLDVFLMQLKPFWKQSQPNKLSNQCRPLWSTWKQPMYGLRHSYQKD
jgi:outer membrane protein TolC